MHDLNLTLFYKTSFQIRALDGDELRPRTWTA